MTDCELIKTILLDGRWHHVIEIMERGKPGTKNWALRSRISELKRKVMIEGLKIESRLSADGQAEYRMSRVSEWLFEMI